MRMKTDNVEESLEPVEVDKAGSRFGLSKMFAVLRYCLTNTLRKQRLFLVSIAHKLPCKHNGH